MLSNAQCTLAKWVAILLLLSACGVSPPADSPQASPVAGQGDAQPGETPAIPTSLTGDADVIFTNGTILTMDDALPLAEAVAIRGNEITAVGSEAEVLAQRGPDTILVDLGGRTLTPGFIDAHQHRILNALQGNTNLEENLRNAIAQGYTTISELYVEPEFVQQYLSLDQQGKFRLRVNMYLAFNRSWGDPIDEWWKAYQPGQVFSPRLRVAGLKVFTDVNNATILVWDQSDLNAKVLELDRVGWHLGIKTVSTRSLEMILDAVEAAREVEPDIVNRRIRLEHALFMTADQIARIKQLGIVPAINLNNPGQLVGEADVDELIAREPEGSYAPWRSLLSSGALAANTTGWPSYYVDEPTGAPFGSPMHLIYQAVTRVGNLGEQPYPWLLDQAITVEQAMRIMTIDSAYADFEDDIKGSLTVGKLADLVILSDNPLIVPTPEINNIKVLMTMIDGRVEFCASGAGAVCPSADDVAVPAPVEATSVPGEALVELHQVASISASASLPGDPPANAVDGDPETAWNSGAAPRQWIRFEFDEPRRISSIHLVAAQDPAGETVHRIWGGLTEDSVQLLHEFIGSTSDGDVLQYEWPSPVDGVKILYVITTESPSWVAWREIRVAGN